MDNQNSLELLKKGLKTLHEIGKEISINLAIQGEKIKASKEKLKDTNAELGRSKNLVEKMLRRWWN